MSEQENLRLIKNAYAAFARGDIPAVLQVLADDVEWRTDGPPEIPYAGTFRGKSGASEFFQKLDASDDIQAFEPLRFFAEGDMVVVFGRYAARVKTTGQIAKADWVHTFVVRDGKVAAYREYLDSAAYAQAYQKVKTPAAAI
jgi:ketosteroid isomerase-like protein